MMKWFDNLRMAKKLALGFGVCLALSISIGAVSIARMSAMEKSAHSMLTDAVGGLADLCVIVPEMNHVRTLQFQILTSSDPAMRSMLENDSNKAQQKISDALSDYIATASSPVDQQNGRDLQNQWNSYLADCAARLTPLSNAHQVDAGLRLMNGPMWPPFHAITDKCETMLDWNKSSADAYSIAIVRDYRAAVTVVAAILLAALIISSAAGVLTSRFIVTHLREASLALRDLQTGCLTSLAEAIARLERGDLTKKAEISGAPLAASTSEEFGEMGKTFNAMLAQLQNTIHIFTASQTSLQVMAREMQESSRHVASTSQSLSLAAAEVGAAADEIQATMSEVAQASEQSATGASEVAQGSTSQARSLADGSDMVKQLAVTALSVASDAEAAFHATQQANEMAVSGAQAVSRTVEGMARIRTSVGQSSEAITALGVSSQQIGAIVETIDAIAAQTNLLALNAAIEAARAGDAGRGFAVVADEVRKLAERSSHATTEITGLIDDVQMRTREAIATMENGAKEVDQGSQLADQAGEALSRILSVVGGVAERAQGISAAAEEMSASSEEVARSISEVAAVVEESSAAAEQMSASAEEVSASVQTVSSTTQAQMTSVEELVSSSEQLAGIAARLNECAGRFQVEDAPAPAAAPRSLARAA